MTGKRFKKLMMGRTFQTGRNEADYYRKMMISLMRDRAAKKLKCGESFYEDWGFCSKNWKDWRK